MRILLVHNRYRSGQPSGENAVVDDEFELLRARGCTVERLELESDSIAAWPVRKRVRLPARVVWSSEGYRLVRTAIARLRPDVAHFHNTFPLFSPSALWAARHTGVRVVQTLHNYRPLCSAATLLRDGRVCEDCLGGSPLPAVIHGCYRGSRLATVPLATMSALHGSLGTWWRCVDALIVLSHFARAKYLEAGWPPNKLFVKPNTVLEPGVPRTGEGAGFVCVSRLTTEKGVDVLLQAWNRAFPGGEERLTIIGDGELGAALRQQGQAIAGVEFTGQLPHGEALKAIAPSRALIVPSRSYEMFPRVVVEAFALGVPVIASRIGSLNEIVQHGKSGLLVPPNSPAALASTLAHLAGASAFANNLRRGAREAYEDRFNSARITDELLAIYRGPAATVP